METRQIGSRRNPLARQAAALKDDPALRRETGLFLCEGARLCRDAARSGLIIESSFFTLRSKEKYGEYLEEILSVSLTCYEVADQVAALLADTKSTQGIFCVCRRPERTAPPADGPCLVLEDLQDPGNLGTVLRTAEALGLSRVFLLGEGCDPWSPKALRASMGAVFRLSLTQEADVEKLCKLLGDTGYALHAAVPDAAARPVTEIDFTAGLHAVFIGNEGRGLLSSTVALCDDSVTIPMAGRAESLNASAAATVLLWEMTRGKKRREASRGG